MGYSFLEFMKSIGIFIICAQSILHFVAEKSYERYVKIIVGIMILAQFIVPVRAVLLGTDNGEIWEAVTEFQEEMETAMENTEVTYEKSEKTEVTDVLQEEIKMKLSDIAERYGYVINGVVLYEEPPGVLVEVTAQTNDSADVTVNEIGAIDKIDRIEIEINTNATISEDKIEREEKSYSDQNIGEMKKEFSTRLGTDETYIEIRVE
ncbi:MAG: stage III sporulation protein AF [Clostridiales bacterium]|nr:stage III sporulation protein AF [Clostridiales bacterium]